MSVIVIVSDSSTSDREFAVALADKLGYSCVQPEVVIERAAARGFSQQKLREALEKPPRVWQRFRHRPRTQLTILRAALVEEIRLGNAVCYGNLGRLLPRIEGLLWIRVDQSEETGCASVRERLKLSPAEAIAWVRKRDRDSRRWRRWVCGSDYDGGLRGAFSVDLESVGVEEACDAIALIVRTRADNNRKQHTVLEDLALSSRVEAALALDPATAHLELEVRADRGFVSVQGMLRSVDELEGVRGVVGEVDGVTGFNLNGIWLSVAELRTRVGSAQASRRISPRLVWASMAAVMVLVIFYAVAVSKVSSAVSSVFLRPTARVVQTFTGVITDTKCAGDHVAMAESAGVECVLRCVRTEPGVRFALHDGKALYVLTDQVGGARFAGRRVAVVGSMDKEAKMLAAKSIRAL